MSRRAGYVIFYIAYIGIVVFLTTQLGAQILDVEAEQLATLTTPPPAPEPGLAAALTYLIDLIVFILAQFTIFITISVSDPTLLFLNAFITLPLSVGFGWVIFELIAEALP